MWFPKAPFVTLARGRRKRDSHQNWVKMTRAIARRGAAHTRGAGEEWGPNVIGPKTTPSAISSESERSPAAGGSCLPMSFALPIFGGCHLFRFFSFSSTDQLCTALPGSKSSISA